MLGITSCDLTAFVRCVYHGLLVLGKHVHVLQVVILCSKCDFVDLGCEVAAHHLECTGISDKDLLKADNPVVELRIPLR